MQKKRERKKKRNRAAPTPVVSGWEKKGKTKWMMNESGREREREEWKKRGHYPKNRNEYQGKTWYIYVESIKTQ